VPQIHVAILARLGILKPVEAGPGNPPHLHHPLHRQSPVGLHFFLGLPVNRGFPVNACSIRCSSMRCKHPFKKSISSACWPILRSSSAMRPSAQRCLPWPGNTLPGPWRTSRRQRCSTLGFNSSARAPSPMELPRSSRCTAASLNSLVNILLDNPMTQFSFGWILSLNWLCQHCGQVQVLDTPAPSSPCVILIRPSPTYYLRLVNTVLVSVVAALGLLITVFFLRVSPE